MGPVQISRPDSGLSLTKHVPHCTTGPMALAGSTAGTGAFPCGRQVQDQISRLVQPFLPLKIHPNTPACSKTRTRCAAKRYESPRSSRRRRYKHLPLQRGIRRKVLRACIARGHRWGPCMLSGHSARAACMTQLQFFGSSSLRRVMSIACLATISGWRKRMASEPSLSRYSPLLTRWEGRSRRIAIPAGHRIGGYRMI